MVYTSDTSDDWLGLQNVNFLTYLKDSDPNAVNAKPLDFALWINLRKELANTFSNTLIEAEDENLSVKAPISILDIEPI